jgi:hypothetical protein
MKYRNVFQFDGQLNHQDIRKYGIDLLRFIYETNNQECFQILKEMNIKKINNMDINTLFTTSAINYQKDTFLYIQSGNQFHQNMDEKTKTFLEGSPKINKILSDYDQKMENMKNRKTSIQKAGGKDIEYQLKELEREMKDIKLDFPREFIFNSTDHAIKYQNVDFVVVFIAFFFYEKHI